MARSANLDFFAAGADHRALLDFLLASGDFRIFESYSEMDSDLREFRSTAELAAAFPIGFDPHGNGYAVLLQLWSPLVMQDLTIRRITLNPAACYGHTFRFCIEGGGLIQLHLGGVCGPVVTMSHFGHQSQVRAAKWGEDRGVDWKALQTLSGHIQRHIRKTMAVGKVPSRPVLPQALGLARAGYALKPATRSPWAYSLIDEPPRPNPRREEGEARD